MKILVADDSKAMRLLVTRCMKQAGFAQHTYIEASNGEEALTAIREQKPDLVLSDWNMPGMTGLEVLKALRAEKNGVKFGFVTSEVEETMREAAFTAGASFFIGKPFSAETFEVGLAAVFEKK